ncbi:zinc finger domain-containing protein [Aliiroseovarius crassostreae]
MTGKPTDFTIHRHPVLAVYCPDCRKGPGAWCARPSGHKASDFHKSRKIEADRLFVEIHGEDASIEREGSGWRIDPTGRADQKPE